MEEALVPSIPEFSETSALVHLVFQLDAAGARARLESWIGKKSRKPLIEQLEFLAKTEPQLAGVKFADFDYPGLVMLNQCLPVPAEGWAYDFSLSNHELLSFLSDELYEALGVALGMSLTDMLKRKSLVAQLNRVLTQTPRLNSFVVAWFMGHFGHKPDADTFTLDQLNYQELVSLNEYLDHPVEIDELMGSAGNQPAVITGVEPAALIEAGSV